MPSFQEIYAEVRTRREESSQDYVLKKYLKRLYKYGKRPTILYASAFSEKEVAGRVLQMTRQDASCLMAAASGMEGDELDLIVHSPGGPVEAAEQIVTCLRRRYRRMRVIVPVCALSTATLLCCAADQIIMAEQSSLGPIDPIVNWSYQGGSYSACAQNIIDEFSIAQRNINNKKNNPILWIEKLKVYPPGLLATCKTQLQLSRDMARDLLESYMFEGEAGSGGKAQSISAWLADTRHFVSGVRPIMYDQAASNALKVQRLEEDGRFADDVMAVFYAAVTKFRTDDCVKVIVNHLGKGCVFVAGVSARSPVETPNGS
jgi:ATP-dependent protease ClpP protease subunit